MPPLPLRTGEPVLPAAASQGDKRPAKSLSWTLINFWLDLALLGVFSVLVWASCVVQFVFPPGPAGFGWKVLGRTLTDWRNIQFVTLMGLTFGLLVHVMFHWTWICGVVRARLLNRPARDDSGADTIWGVGFLVFLLHLLGAGLLAGWVTRTPL